MNEQVRAEFESSVDDNEHTITSRQCLTEKDTGRVVAVFYNDYDLQEVVDQLEAAHARYAGSDKQTRTELPEGVTRVRNAATGEYVRYTTANTTTK